jgi:branched-subunit amino acid aminotransferase/4-amino-4-deoxychorismate lyase
VHDFIILNGELVSSEQAKVSVFDHGFLYGDGIYETLQTLNGKPLNLQNHLKRLHSSANLMQIDVPWSDEKLEKMITDLITANTIQAARVRITVTRGQNSFDFTGATSPTLVITSSAMADYSKFKTGVDVTTLKMIRVLPEAKTISLLPMILAKQKAQNEDCFECLFLDDNGMITEGSVCNILSRKENNVFVTPSAKILAGTKQKQVLQALLKSDYKVAERSFTPQEVTEECDEVLLLNSIFGVLPVKSIEKRTFRECAGKLYKYIGEQSIA